MDGKNLFLWNPTSNFHHSWCIQVEGTTILTGCHFERSKCSVEKLAKSSMQAYLLNDIKAKLEPLFLQHWHEMSQEDGQMLMSVPERD